MSRATRRKAKDKKSKNQAMLLELAEEQRMITCGIYEKISKSVIGAKKVWRKNKRFVEEQLDEVSEYKDAEYPPDNSNLMPLTEQNSKIAKYFAWYRMHAYFEKKYSIFNNIKLKNQIIRNRGYVYLIDALNTLTAQPGLILRLFERRKVNREGIYSVWINIDGRWQQEIVDDHVPIMCDHKDKNTFFFTNPNPKEKELWYMLLEKAMAKAYGGYKNLFHGFENYAIRDLTGAPHIIYDIPPVPLGKAIRQREVDHMNDFWEVIFKGLKKGYVLSLVPRLPTQTEKIANRNLKIPNKNYYMSNGLYSGHNYAIVTAKEVRDSKGNTNRLIKLRNPFINEVWQGDFSHNSSLWTEELKKSLGYDPEKQGFGDFWISIRDIMGYFEVLNTYKIMPGYTYNSIDIAPEDRRITRTFVKIVVPKTGKYTFSVDQKDLRNWGFRGLSYSSVKLSLGKINKENFQLLSHTSSKKLRNTFIRKLIEKGEYFLLIEKNIPDENIKLAQQNPEDFKELNSFVVSSYGPKTCGMNIVDDLRKNYAVYDYVCYFGWKWYSMQRIGQKVSEFNVNFYDGSWNKMSLYLLNIPDLIIYAFKNDHNFGVELTTRIGGLPGREILGAEGKKSYEQKFSMNAGESDVFLFRNTRDDNTLLTKENNKFQLKSVVGMKYIGVKDNPPTFQQFYDFLKKINVKAKKCEIEKDSVLKEKIGLYDVLSGNRKIEFKNDDVNQVKVIKMTKPMKLDQYEDLVDANDLIEREKSLHDQNAKIRAKSQPSKFRNGEKIVERIRLEDFLKEKGKDPSKLEEIKKHIKPETLEALKQEAPKEEPPIQKAEVQIKNKISKNSFLKNQLSPIPESRTEKFDHEANLKSLEKYSNTVTHIDDNKLAKVLTLQKEELLNIEEDELKQLLKYFGVQAFITIYQVDDQFLDQIVKKLDGKNFIEKTEFRSRANRNPVSSRNRSGNEGMRLGETQNVHRELPSKSVGRIERTPRESQKAYQDRQVVEYPDLLQQKEEKINDPHLASLQENLSEMILSQKQTQDLSPEEANVNQKAGNFGYTKDHSSRFNQIQNQGYANNIRMENPSDFETEFREERNQISEKIRQRLTEIRNIKERISQQVSNISQQHSKNSSPTPSRGIASNGLKYQILNQHLRNGSSSENSHHTGVPREEREVYNGINESNYATASSAGHNQNMFKKKTEFEYQYNFHTEKKQKGNFSSVNNYQSESKSRRVEIEGEERFQELQNKIDQKRQERNELHQQISGGQNVEERNLIQSLEEEKIKQLKEQEELLRLVEEAKKQEEQMRLDEENQRIIEEQNFLEEQRRAEEQKRIEEQQKRVEEQQKRAEEQRRAEEEQKRAEEQRRAEEEQRIRIEEQIRAEEQRRNEEEQRRRIKEEQRILQEKQRLQEEERRKIEEHEQMILEKIRRENEEIKRQHELQKSQVKERGNKRRSQFPSPQMNFYEKSKISMNESIYKSKKQNSNLRKSDMKRPKSFKNKKGPGRKTFGDPISSQIQQESAQRATIQKSYHNNTERIQRSSSKHRRPSYTKKIPALDHYDPTVERFNRLKKTLQQKRILAENNSVPFQNQIGGTPSIKDSHYTNRPIENKSLRTTHYGKDLSRPQTGNPTIDRQFHIQRPKTPGNNMYLSNVGSTKEENIRNRIKKTMNRSNHTLKFHQNEGNRNQFSPNLNHSGKKMGSTRAPFRNKRARNTTNPGFISRNEPRFEQMNMRQSPRRERLGSGAGLDRNVLTKSSHQNILLAQQAIPGANQSPINNGRPRTRGKTNQMNIQAIPVHNPNISRNAITERSASSRQLGLLHQNQPNQIAGGMGHPQQQQQMPHYSPSPTRPHRQFPQNKMRSSADFQPQVQPQANQFQNMNYYVQPEQPQQPQMMPQNNYNRQRPNTSNSNMNQQNFNMTMSSVNPMNGGGYNQNQMGSQQFNNHFNQTMGGGGFRSQSPVFNPNQPGGGQQKKLAYGNQRPKSSRGTGASGFLSGLFR